MSLKTLTVGLMALALAVPAAAQQAAQQQDRGTVEFGAFGSVASFDKELSLAGAYGGGGRAAMHLDPRWSIEFEMAEMRASRPDGLKDVNVGILASRLILVPLKLKTTAFMFGLGAGHSTETNFLHSYGVGALAGFKVPLGENYSFRLDGTMDWLANEDWKRYQSVRAGLSFYRRPFKGTRLVMTPGPRTVERPDAAELSRLRQTEIAYRALRDSLANAPVGAYTTAATLATMEAPILFAFNDSVLSDDAMRALDAKIAVARSNPSMAIIMLGYTDVIGTDAYNMALGSRRAQAAKDYLVSRGIAANRVIIESRGQRDQVPGSAGEAGEAENRRAVFRLLIAPTVIRPR